MGWLRTPLTYFTQYKLATKRESMSHQIWMNRNIMFLLMYILMLNAINMTLQRWGRISLGFLSTKIHKDNQSIHKNIPKFLVRQEQGEYYGEKKLYICIWKMQMHEFMDGYKTFIIICSILRLWSTNKLQKILTCFVYLKLWVIYIFP